MTAITFPTDPSNGELYTAPNGSIYIWDGEKWTVNSTIYTGPALENISQDRVAPMFVNGVNTGITFAYNSTTNVMTTSVADSDRLVNGVHEFTLESNGTVTLDGDPFTGFSGAYADLTGAPTIPADVSDLTDTTNLLFDGAYSSLTGAPTIPADVSDLTDTTNLLDGFSGDYNDLTNITGTNGPENVAIGREAHLTFTYTPGFGTVAIGYAAGRDNQGGHAVAIGWQAGQNNQSDTAIAIGYAAGQIGQEDGAVAIGAFAGNQSQGADAIAIGKYAGYNGTGVAQPDNTIFLNATGAQMGGVAAQTNSFYVAPIRNASGTSGLLQYNATTKEVSYSNEITVNSKTWTFGADGTLTIPGGISSIDHLNLDADYDGGYSVYIGSNHPTAGMLGGVVLGDNRGGFVQVISQKLIVGQTAVPAHSTGAVGDVEGQVAFDSNYIYYCTANYNQVGHQVTGADYLGRGSLNTNAFQLTKTADTLQITVGDIISDSDGGATSTVVTVSSDENYTYVGTGGMAYNAVLPLTFTSTDYVSGGNIWKRVAWSGDTW